jgi:replicative DNA helicase
MTDMERSLLASVIERGTCFDEVGFLVAPEDFTSAAGQETWRVCAALHANGDPVDLPIVLRALGDTKDGDQYQQDLLEAVSGTFTASSIEGLRTLAENVHEGGALTALSKRCSEIASRIVKGEATLTEVHDAMRESIEATTRADVKAEQIGKSPAIAEAVASLSGGRQRGLMTGWSGLDGILNGLRKGSVYVVAGRTSMGKSSYALALAVKTMSEGPVLYASTEMTMKEIAERILCMRAEFHTSEDLGAAALSLADVGLYVMDTPGLTIDAIYCEAKRLQRSVGLVLVIVDYLQQIRAPRRYVHSREREVAEVSAAVKDAAKRLSVPWVTVAQINRSVEGRKDHSPRMSDLRESGSLEMDAQGVLLLYRPGYYKPTLSQDTFVVTIAKHTHGPVGRVEMTANLARCLFSDAPKTTGADDSNATGWQHD